MEFTPEQKVLNDLFGNDITYTIPEYQRPYSWDCIGKSDRNNQIIVIWQDLIDFYESKNENIYFMGSMVVIGDGTTRQYDVVDGQQRLTTLTILLTAIKCFLNEVSERKNIEPGNEEEFLEFIKSSSDNVDKLIFNEKRNGLYTRPEKKVKIERTVGFDYDSVLKVVMECGDLSAIPTIDATDEQREVTFRYFKNRQYFVDRLKEKFLDENILTREKATNLSDFFDFLKNKVTVVQIRAPKFDVAYQIFEILNNRGLPLSNKDLFRNFLISEFFLIKSSGKDKNKFDDLDPNEKWRNLELKYDLDSEFISRYVESKLGKNQQYSAFNDLQKIYKEKFSDSLSEKKIFIFYKDIEANLANYSKILNLEFIDKRLNNCISFLRHAGNGSYTLNLILALMRVSSDELRIYDFLKEYEKYIIFNILGPSRRFAPKPIYAAINLLNESKIVEAKKEFLLSDEEKTELGRLLNSQIKENDIAKLVIAKYFYALENSKPEDVVVQELDYNKATLEHIIPQNPEKATNWLDETYFDSTFRLEYTYKLGNMTLLTKRMNSSAKNSDFEKKRSVYEQTKLPMTVKLANLVHIDKIYIKRRHDEIVNIILTDLDIVV